MKEKKEENRGGTLICLRLVFPHSLGLVSARSAPAAVQYARADSKSGNASQNKRKNRMFRSKLQQDFAAIDTVTIIVTCYKERLSALESVSP